MVIGTRLVALMEEHRQARLAVPITALRLSSLKRSRDWARSRLEHRVGRHRVLSRGEAAVLADRFWTWARELGGVPGRKPAAMVAAGCG